MQSIPYWLAALLLVVLSAVVFLTIFVWRWAVRQSPASTRSGASQADDMSEPRYNSMPVLAALGASDVSGVGLADPDNENWASVLQTLMPQGTQLVRLSRPGITLRDANSREIFDAVRTKPDSVVFWYGINDITKRIPLADYTRELEIALTRLTLETAASKILVLNIPDISRLLPAAVSESQRRLVRGGIEQWNRAIESRVNAYTPRVRLLDLFSVSEETMAQKENVAADGFHLSAAGHRALARLAWEALRED